VNQKYLYILKMISISPILLTISSLALKAH
jgi:hypothetical protein